MKTSVENIDPVTIKLTVEVEPKRVKQAFDKAARELAKDVNLPGFRPGKAPRRLIEQRFGAGVIAQTAMEGAISEYYVEALRSEEIDPVAQPDVDVENFDEADGCRFTAQLEIRPSIDPPEITGIDVTFPEWEVDDADVDERIADLRERFAEVEEVERAAKKGDLITIDLRVEIDGEELADGNVEDALYEIGSGGVTPKLDEEAVGAGAGDTFTYEDALPEEYPDHGGKTATFHVTVKDVREKTLPELDDDFASSASGYETMEELRNEIRASLLRARVQEGQQQLRASVLEAYLARAGEVPLPPAMVAEDRDRRRGSFEERAKAFNRSLEEILEGQGTTLEEFEANAQQQAELNIRAQLVLDALVIELKPEVEGSDLDEELMRYAQASNTSPQEIALMIQERRQLPVLINDILRRKALDAIVAAANIEGAPSEETLVELGLAPAPDAPDAAAGDEPDDEASA